MSLGVQGQPGHCSKTHLKQINKTARKLLCKFRLLDSVGSHSGHQQCCKERDILSEMFSSCWHTAVVEAAHVSCGVALLGSAHPEGGCVGNSLGKVQFQGRDWAP